MHRRSCRSLLSIVSLSVAIAFLLLSALAPAAPAIGAPPEPIESEAPPDRFAALLDERMPGFLAEFGVPGSAIAAIKDGDVAWTRAYGLANVAAGEPMRPDMVFEHGSNGKALTAWAVARLVDAGRIDLDQPVNRYLTRWQLPSSASGDAGQVTVRRLLSHTSGLNIHGYLDYSPRRAALPGLAQILDSPHLAEGLAEYFETGRLSPGSAALVQQPGAGYKYSGAGYTVLQMLVEDVTGEPFDAFIRRQVTDPLGASGIRWAWTPELRAAAPVPYGNEGQALEYRQLANHAIGSEIATVADFARFLAAAVPGPHGEPAGRGVLKPETVAMMTAAQPGTGSSYGLGYVVATNYGEPAVLHSGANSGWTAYYFLDKARRSGFVVASNSSRATPLHFAVLNVWSAAWFGQAERDMRAGPRFDSMAIMTFGVAGLLALGLLVAVALFVRQARAGRRGRVSRPTVLGLLWAVPWLLWLLFIWYTLYSPLPLYLPYGFPDFWPSPAVTTLIGVLLGWLAFRLYAAFHPRARAAGST